MAESSEIKTKVTLYWLEASRAQRIVWLLEECKNVDWQLETFKRGDDKLAPKELKKIHPLGKSPLVKIEAPARSEPMILAESGFIMEYLAENFAPHLIPKRYLDGKDGQVGGETEEWLRYRYFMHYVEGSLMGVLVLGLFVDGIRTAPVPFFIKPITRGIAGKVESTFLSKELKSHFDLLESRLASSPGGGHYLCGKELTPADISISFPLIAAKEKVDAAAYPKLTAYTKMLEQNEVYLRTVKKVEELTGEPFKVVP